MEEIEKLKKIKEAHSLGYEDISKSLNVSFQTVYNWCKGNYNPSKLALDKIRKFIKKYEK